eukprot:SAG11_NODE_1139_length_5714_cov_20.900267_4_plen_84_part_00
MRGSGGRYTMDVRHDKYVLFAISDSSRLVRAHIALLREQLHASWARVDRAYLVGILVDDGMEMTVVRRATPAVPHAPRVVIVK